MYAVPVSHGRRRRVLDRVPRPHAAPAEHLVAPPAAEQDADREEAPREQRPAARLQQPALADATGDQRRDRERERHREPDVAEVQDRRVEQHERRGSAAAGSGPARRSRPTGGPAANGSAGPKLTSAKNAATTNITTSAQPTSGSSSALAEPPRDGRRVTRRARRPQQDRALERAPHRGDVVERRRRARPDLLHVLRARSRGVISARCIITTASTAPASDRATRTAAPGAAAAVAADDRERRRQRADASTRQHQQQPGVAERAVEAGGDHGASGPVAASQAAAVGRRPRRTDRR